MSNQAQLLQAEPDVLAATVPLVVDLDGTLIRSDLLIETAFGFLGEHPLAAGRLLAALWRGKQHLKTHIAEAVDIDPDHLPYNADVLALIRQARAQGRKVYLASASHEDYVQAICDHLALFDGYFGTNRSRNLAGKVKAQLLVEAFGEKGFDYIGDSRADLDVWVHARHSIAVSNSTALYDPLKAIDTQAQFITPARAGVRDWLKLLRVHQWSKNTLVFVPLITAHAFHLADFGAALLAFFIFSLTASSIYIINDLVDIQADRAHPTKCKRPFAAGTISPSQAMLFVPFALGLGTIGASFLPVSFGVVLASYIVLTTLYSFYLKRKMLVDIVALAALYSVRVVAGAEAIDVEVSEWLIGFSMFAFTSLALIKRYIELSVRLDGNLADPGNRNYRKADMPIIASLAAAVACNAVTVFAIYINSSAVHLLYRNPRILWLICPILLYLFGRMLLLAHRRLMNDDPIVFAVKDRISFIGAGLIGAIIWIAI